MRAGWFLALALVLQQPQHNDMAYTRNELFDHVSIRLPDDGSWQVMARTNGEWTEVPSEVFEDGPGTYSLHFHASALGVPGKERAPGPAPWRIRAQAGQDLREGFLVQRAMAPKGKMPLWGDAFESGIFSLDFTGGSGFYHNLRTRHGLLAESIGFYISGRVLGVIPFKRTDADFRFTSIQSDGGPIFARRRADVSVRALVSWSNPKPSALFLGPAFIEQEVLIDLPRPLILLGNAIDVENWFSLGPGLRVLIPGGTHLESPQRLPPHQPYEWIVLVTAGGAFIHWLELPGEEQLLNPRMIFENNRNGGWRAGYRIENIEDNLAEADPEGDGIRMIQRVAWLGGPDFVQSLADGDTAARLSEALNRPYAPWQVELEALP